MKKTKLLLTLIITGSIFTTPLAYSAPLDAQQLLEKSDEIKTLGDSYTLDAEILSYQSKKLDENKKLKLYSFRENAQSQFKSLIKYEYPNTDKGKLMLKNEDNLWAFDPNSKASIPISPQQRLTGQAANGDVVTSVWALDYSASFLKEESIQDGHQAMRDTILLELTAKNSSVTYDKIHFWIDKNTYSPVKANFFTKSGNILKTAFYRKEQFIYGKNRPTETIIIDGVNTNWVTIMKTNNHKLEDIPRAWFQRAYLPNIQD